MWNAIRSRRAAVAAACAIAMGATACGSSDDDDAAAGGSGTQAAATQPAKPKGFKLGFAYGLEDTPIYQNVLRPTKVEAEKQNVTLQSGSADSKCDKQIQDIQYMLQSGVDAVVMLGLCGKGNAYNKILANARAKKIATVTYAFQMPDADGSIQFNDAQGAKLFADDAIAWIKANFKPPYKDFSYANLACSFAPPSIQMRTAVVAKAVTELTGKKPYDSVDCALSPDPAKKAVTTYLRKDPGLDMVISVVDAGAYGAYLAMKQAGGKRDKVYVGGMDGTQESIALLARGGDGIYRFSGALPFRELGAAVVDVPKAVLEGTGATSTMLNYTAVTAADPDKAQAWLEDNFPSGDGQ